MGYKITSKKAENINVDFIFKLDTLSNHFEESISIIIPISELIEDFKHLYEPKNIKDYYDRIKWRYESRRCEWKNRKKLWQTS
jgi:hypothetical protein